MDLEIKLTYKQEVLFLVDDNPYQFGDTIERYSNLLIQVDRSGLLTIQGYKL